MGDIHRNIDTGSLPAGRTVLWVRLHRRPGHVTTGPQALTLVWRGDLSWAAALRCADL